MSMKFSGVLVAGAVALVGLAGLTSVAKANSSTAIGLSATVADACSFGTVTNITFATDYEPGQLGTLTGSGDFIVNCTVNNQSITLTPDGGNNAGGGLGRQLVHSTDVTQLLGYSMLISDTDGLTADQAFDASVGYVPATDLSNGDNTFKVDAIIGASQTVTGGSYGDSVSIVMSF